MCKKRSPPIDGNYLKCQIFVCRLNQNFNEIRAKCLQKLETAENDGNGNTIFRFIKKM